MTAPLLQVETLSVTIRRGGTVIPIVEQVTFQLERGMALGVVGESGCGKSMTALAIIGLLPPAAQATGTIRFDGADLLSLSERALCRLRGNRIAMVFQEPQSALNPVKTIGAQVAEPMRIHAGLSRAAAEESAVALLDRVGLPRRRFSPDLYPHQLSGGQCQRVGIAAAIACGPQLLIADEPTTALDVTVQAQILDLIAELVEETGMALILITHDLGLVAENTDRMAVMYAGTVVETGSTAGVFAALAHPYTRGLFSALPQAHDTGHASGRLATIPGTVPEPAKRPSGCLFADRCRRADADCRVARPALLKLEAGHEAACIHPHQAVA